MAGVKISALPALSVAQLTDIYPTVQGSTTYKVSLSQILQNVSTHTECRLATTGALNATYDNGVSGVGATLTNAGALAALTIDGVLTVADDRILVKDQAATLQNGIYVVTVVGDGATAWVLTRASGSDEAEDIDAGDAFTVAFGTVNAKTQWIETAVVTTMGADPITFESNVVAGSGITKTNNVISLTQSDLINAISIQTFSVNGTYTPTSGMLFCIVEICGAGGGSGGVTGGTAGQSAAASGGGGGGYARILYTAAEIGANAAVVIGAIGAKGAAGANNGSAGGNSSFNPAGTGVTITANGGAGGLAMAKGAGAQTAALVAGGSATNGDINIQGGNGGFSATQAAGALAIAGQGGSSFWGSAAGLFLLTAAGGGDGNSGSGYGAGAGGAADIATSDRAGADGQPAFCIVTEFLSV